MGSRTLHRWWSYPCGALALALYLTLVSCGPSSAFNKDDFITLLNLSRDNLLIESPILDDMAQWYCTKIWISQNPVHTLVSPENKENRVVMLAGQRMSFWELIYAQPGDQPQVTAEQALSGFGHSPEHWEALSDESQRYIGVYSIEDTTGFWLVVYVSTGGLQL